MSEICYTLPWPEGGPRSYLIDIVATTDNHVGLDVKDNGAFVKLTPTQARDVAAALVRFADRIEENMS